MNLIELQCQGRLDFYKLWDAHRHKLFDFNRANPHNSATGLEAAAWTDGWNKGVAEVDRPELYRRA